MATEWTKAASLYDGPRAVGGSLRVGSGRIRFKAHVVDKMLNGREVDLPLAEVTRLSLTERSLVAPRRHVLVEMQDGTRARCLVNGAKNVLRRLAGESMRLARAS